VIEMVAKREDLGNAIALNSALLPGAGCCTGGALIFASKLSKLVELVRPAFRRLESCRIDRERKTAPAGPEIH